MRNTRMKQIMVLVYLLATAALFAPIMSGSIVGERVGGVFVIRGYNLVEFAPAAWIMLLSRKRQLRRRIEASPIL